LDDKRSVEEHHTRDDLVGLLDPVFHGQESSAQGGHPEKQVGGRLGKLALMPHPEPFEELRPIERARVHRFPHNSQKEDPAKFHPDFFENASLLVLILLVFVDVDLGDGGGDQLVLHIHRLLVLLSIEEGEVVVHVLYQADIEQRQNDQKEDIHVKFLGGGSPQDLHPKDRACAKRAIGIDPEQEVDELLTLVVADVHKN